MTNFSYTGSHPLEEVVKELTTDRDEWRARAERAERERDQLRAELDAARTWRRRIEAPLHTPIIVGYMATLDDLENIQYGAFLGWLPAAPGDGDEEG